MRGAAPIGDLRAFSDRRLVFEQPARWQNDGDDLPQLPTSLPAGVSPSLDPALQRRIMIESVAPEVDGGRFPIKRTPGETVTVEADVFADGHDMRRRRAAVAGARRGSGGTKTPWSPWATIAGRAHFAVVELGAYEFTVEGWIDRFETWRQELSKKVGGRPGRVERAARRGGARAGGAWQDARRGAATGAGGCRRDARGRAAPEPRGWRVALAPELAQHMAAARGSRAGPRDTTRVLSVLVERERARFGAWYEMFPRSAGSDPTRSATFDEAAARLPYVAAMGFDVLYLPPIHPIGRSFRKGRNNSLDARRPTIRAARGRSAPRKVVTRRSSPGSARSRTSIASSTRRGATASRLRSTSRSRRRPIIPT